jgi:PKD repeat protein
VVRACTIEPDFKWTIDSIYPLRGVQFRNTTPVLTTQVLPVRWSFGDGTESSEWSPFHKYEKPGIYKVCLKIAFFEGCTKEICKTVVVPEPVNCERLSNFEVRQTTEPNTIKAEAAFANSSLKYVWTFGDGTGAFTSSTSHKYARPGKYTICLTVYRGENCASTTCKEFTVGPLPCSLTIVKFEYQRLNAAGNTIKFNAVSNQPILSQRWTIQRDNASTPVVINTNNPTYTFTQSGIYKVCLRALTINGCVKEYCETIRIGEVPPNCTLQVTPNPATTQIFFRLELRTAQTVTASLIDQSGVRRSVHFFNGAQGWNSFNIGIATLPAGYYTLEVKYNGIVCVTKFQKVN